MTLAKLMVKSGRRASITTSSSDEYASHPRSNGKGTAISSCFGGLPDFLKAWPQKRHAYRVTAADGLTRPTIFFREA
jgi:hypothetical protein